MPPQTGTALVLIAAFLLPGFVTVLIQERTFKSADDPTPLDRLLRVLYYSVWIYLLLAGLALIFGIDRNSVTDLYDRYQDDPAQLVWRAGILILVPAFVVANSTRWWAGSEPQRRLHRLLKINSRHEEPTAWDHHFRQRGQSYVRLTAESGARIYGYYGERSFAAYAKDGRDLFLERVYIEDDDWFGREVTGSAGVWVSTEKIVAAEFYNPFDGESQHATDAGDTPVGGGEARTRPSEANDRAEEARAASPESEEGVAP